MPRLNDALVYFNETVAAMSGYEQMSFAIFLVMTITFFLWILYLVVSP